MSKSVAGGFRAAWNEGPALYCSKGRRKYLTNSERMRALEAASKAAPERALFATLLAWTGARVSEVLALTPESFQMESSVVSIRTLKRRRPIVREVPIPPSLIISLEAAFDIRSAQHDPMRARHRLFSFDRTTAWRTIKAAMAGAGISGTPACPRGFRHGYGVHAIQSGIPLNLLQRWLGHSRLTTTAIYADAVGPEECLLAARLWRAQPNEVQGGRGP